MPRSALVRTILALVPLALALLAPAARPECVDYGDYLHRVSTLPLQPTTSGRIAADDGLAFVCRGATGLMILDISDPAAPQLVTTYNTPGTCFDVAAAGNIVYVADGASGLLVLDVFNPASPQVVTTFTPGSISFI